MQTTFVYLHTVQNSDVAVCLGTTVLILACYTIHSCLNRELDCNDFANSFGSFIFLILVLAFLTPVLQSLTISYSSDTVTVLAVLLSICHLWSYDFEPARNLDKTLVVRSPKSLNAIFLATILLSSRLTRFTSVFLLLFQSLLLFGFGPFFRQELLNFDRSRYEAYTIVTTLILFGIIFALNHAVGVIYLISALVIPLGGPLLFIYAYKFKK